MRLVIFAPFFYPHKGGSEQYAWEVATRLVKKGYKVEVISSKINRAKKFEKIAGITISRLESKLLLGGRWPLPKYNSENRATIRYIFKQKPSLIITNTRFFPLSFWGAWLARRNRIPQIHIEHGSCHPELESWHKRWLAKFYDLTFGKFVIKSAHLNIAVSKAAQKFARYLGAKKTIVIPNSIDTKYFQPKPRQRANKKTQIIYLGRLIQAKGVHDLIEAFQKIKNENIRLKIIGSGDFQNILHKMARLDKRISFLGEKQKTTVKNILQESDILVNPSYSEGLPTSVLEAGAMELSVIATSVGGTGEIINDNVNGFLIKPKDTSQLKNKLEALFLKPSLRKQFGQKLRQKIKLNFDWQNNTILFEKTIKQYLK